jgi:hypothetical protein
MRASPVVLASAYSFVNQSAAPVAIPPSLLRGRWSCTILEPVGRERVRTLATGLLDVLHAGSYLVGSGWLDGTRDPDPAAGDPGAATPPPAGLEGPLFGAVRGDEVVLWVTNVFRTAMWVLKGTLDPRGRTIQGTAVYTDMTPEGSGSYEAHFTLTAR